MIQSGKKSVTTAGTQVALATTRTTASWVFVQANNTNTGAIHIGDSGVDNSEGVRLLSSEGFMFPDIGGVPYDLQAMFVDSDVNGEGVRFVFGKK